MAFAFEKLLVYQKSVDFANQACDLTEQFLVRYQHLADQVNCASLFIASSIAEGNGRFTKPERKHFFGIARGSVQGCVPQLELARRRKLVSDEHHAQLKFQLEEISRMLRFLPTCCPYETDGRVRSWPG
jgi:four helix bundle protein